MSEFVIDKDGYLEGKKKKKVGTKWVVYYVLLSGSSLFLYKQETDASPCITIQLEGSKVKAIDASGKPGFVIHTEKAKEKPKITDFRCRTESEQTEWVNLITEAKSKPKTDPPTKEEVVRGKNGTLFRAKKNISGKLATSSAGKKAIRKNANEETVALIESVHTIIERTYGKKQADEIEKSIIKLFLKSYFQFNQKTITMDDFGKADKPLREAFKIFDKMFAFYGTKGGAALEDGMVRFNQRGVEIEQALTDMLRPYLQAHNMMRLHQTVQFLSSVEFLKRVWDNDTLEDDLFNLVSAMNRYIQFEP